MYKTRKTPTTRSENQAKASTFDDDGLNSGFARIMGFMASNTLLLKKTETSIFQRIAV